MFDVAVILGNFEYIADSLKLGMPPVPAEGTSVPDLFAIWGKVMTYTYKESDKKLNKVFSPCCCRGIFMFN